MNNNIDTKEIERRAYFKYHSDGIIDIFLGISIMMFTVSLINTTISMVWMIALFPLFYRDTKRRYTFPRLGYVKFTEKIGASGRSTMLAMALAALTLVVGFLVFFSGFPDNYDWMVPFIENWKLVAAGFSLVALSLFGYMSEIKRLYYYAVGSFILFAAGAIIPIQGYIILPVIGGLITLSGGYHLYRFTQEYPLEPRTEYE
jgi:hypothetical protein